MPRTVRYRRISVRCAWIAVAAATVLAAGIGSAGGASTGAVTVAVNVTNATFLDATGCASGSAATTFGTTQPGSSQVVAGCHVTFGSNITATLRVRQVDGTGVAMHTFTKGALDTTAPFVNGVAKQASMAGDQAWYPSRSGLAGIDVLPDGRIIQASTTAGFANGLVVAYNPDGTRDTTGWGASGFASIDLGTTADYPTDVVTTPAGRTIVGGFVRPSYDYMAVGALTSAGTTDATFGTAGKTVFDATPGYSSQVTDIALQSDGSVVAGGMYNIVSNFESVVAKFKPDGTVDTSFGTAGAFVNGSGLDMPSSYNFPVVATMRDGRILLGQHDYDHVQLTMLTADGQLDTSWATGGRWTFDNGQYANLNLMAIDDAGRIVLGQDDDSTLERVIRVLPSGTIDTSFGGGDGVVDVTIPGTSQVYVDGGITTDPTGAIYFMGDANFGGSWRIYVAKVAPNGSGLDTSFGTAGVRSIDLGANPEGADGGLAWQDGNLLLSASWNPGANRDLVLGRLATTTTISDYGGAATWASGPTQSLFGACLETVASATAVWTEAPGAQGCTTADAGHWNAIPRRETSASRIASTSGPQLAAAVDLVFGTKVASAITPGAYSAPLSFDVVAPAV